MTWQVVVLFVGLLTTAAFVVSQVLRHKLVIRELLHKERLAAIERGVDVPASGELLRPPTRRQLRTSITLVGIGAGLVLAAILVVDHDARVTLNAFGAFVGAIGLAHLGYYLLVGRKEWRRAMNLHEEMAHAYFERLAAGSTTGEKREPLQR